MTDLRHHEWTDILDTLAISKWLSTQNLKSGYWQLILNPRKKVETAVSTKYCLEM
jgi:hypothetical protein